jgi:hypothetical protein
LARQTKVHTVRERQAIKDASDREAFSLARMALWAFLIDLTHTSEVLYKLELIHLGSVAVQGLNKGLSRNKDLKIY